MRIILWIILVLLYYKYWVINIDNKIIYYILVALYEWILIYLIYFITKNKLYSVLIFAITEAFLYIFNNYDEYIIIARIIALTFWIWIYILWKKYKYIWYVIWIFIHIIYNLSITFDFKYVALSLIMIMLYIGLLD